MYQKELESHIGQMLMVGISGDVLSQQQADELSSYNIGGVGLFNVCPPPKESNVSSPQQLKKLCAQLQANSSVPLFIAVDQEGGKVARLSEKNGFIRPPSPKEMALSDSTNQHYQLIARTLKEHGINFNFAPCVDVDINVQNPIIGAIGRSFSSNPQTVANCGFEAWQAQKKEGVLSCLKHFPGHGSSTSDTHLGMADITTSHQKDELLPYKQLIQQGFDEFILTAHVIHKDYSVLPASLAPEYPKMLREWGFRGLIVTDDLKMGALEKHFSLQDTLIHVVNSGADILAYFNNLAPYRPDYLSQAMKILVDVVQTKLIPEARILESSARIASFKKEKLTF
ncbi:MAG: glycoside hydrolase family 3 N-terminal domain-containing protein [Brevinema sp.]